jgi:hypothetical protein
VKQKNWPPCSLVETEPALLDPVRVVLLTELGAVQALIADFLKCDVNPHERLEFLEGGFLTLRQKLALGWGERFY